LGFIIVIVFLAELLEYILGNLHQIIKHLIMQLIRKAPDDLFRLVTVNRHSKS
jgi:hypothetical protein